MHRNRPVLNHCYNSPPFKKTVTAWLGRKGGEVNEGFSPLTVDDYAAMALTTDQRSDGGSLTFPLLGLFGETGSLLSEVKKKQRDRASYLGYASAVAEELGDVLWYLTAVAARGKLALKDIVIAASKGSERALNEAEPLTFAALQREIMSSQTEPSPAFEKTLLHLAGEVGLLVIDQEAGRLGENSSALASRLIEIVRALLKAADEAGITLEAAAVKNLSKIFDRWPDEKIYPELLDVSADPDEQLPRSLCIEIFEREVRGQQFVYQRCNGLFIGDRLTDNAMTADDYRFHDVLHFGYWAILGWSPVVRALLRLKRKRDAKIDEVEDGARAALIEEGITTWVFGQAMELNFFEGKKPRDLPFGLLKTVKQFVTGYEVQYQPMWLWEEAILAGYEAFRFLRKHRRGRITVDMANHQLLVSPL
jgi:NTP pyrophosphatase (non-canonical NTP hydrolase)